MTDLFGFIVNNLQGDIYLNAIMGGLFQVISYPISGVLIEYLGVRKQLFLCYMIPFLSAFIFLSTTYIAGGEFYGPFAYALFIGMILFGFASNYSATLYAAYSCSPPALAPTFLVVMNFMKVLFLTLTPYIAQISGAA